ncbi:MAG TPA: aminotransferase class I/II-fold pyridoxal phosphate-dependent enzyme, partial [Candidatus Sulfotelmatobacter sp.]|nr:aminotransferase class I/II-fold pyridoxal phosphate-dependent enzyme [Candidatus Sulfotelmatobacter sp.]
MALLAERIRLIDTENAFKIGPQIREIEGQGKRVVKCNLGEPDFPLPQFIKDEVKRQIDLDNTHYCDPQGILSLRKAIAKHFSDTRGIRATPERVVVFPGAKPPIGLCQQAYCNPGDEVVYPSPGFPIYESFIAFVGARAVPLHLKEEENFSLSGKDVAAALSPKTKILILNFPSNPTGGVASKAQLAEIAEAVRTRCGKDVRVFADEVYEDILFDGSQHHSVIGFPGMEERTILVSGASKSYSWTGGRLGWALFPTVEEAEVFRNLNINYFSCVPAYNQEGARLALESSQSADAIHGMVSAFQQRRELVVDGLNGIPGIRCQRPKGAFYVFPNIRGACEALGIFEAFRGLPRETQKRTSPSTLFQMFLLWEYQVATLDRKSFGRIGTEDMHYLRLSIATDLDSLREGVKRIEAAAQDREGFARFFKAG